MLNSAVLSAEPEFDDVGAYVAAQENKSLLRFLTCGSVDDGKSTLIGRLLYDTKLIFEDQLASLTRDSRRHGTAGDDIDFALLVDGLEAEREQGITIDVAYRFFATGRRKFIVADTPGHEQYTRNMATGASTADLAVVLVDARQGVLTQTRRHSIIASLLGIRHIALAVNKIDLVGFDPAVFEAIVGEYRTFAASLGFETIAAIPMSARHGDNVTRDSSNTPWYQGPTLLDHLETVDTDRGLLDKPFRFPVQYVVRPDLDFRGYAGTVASGTIAVGDAVTVAESGRPSRIRRIVTHDGDLRHAAEGQAVTLVLADELDISRGNLLAEPQRRPYIGERFAATLVWFGEAALTPGRTYLLRTETAQVNAAVSGLRHRIDVETYQPEGADRLGINEVGLCEIATQTPIAFDCFDDNRTTGSFVLIDRMTNATVAAGMIREPLARPANVHWQALDVQKASRAALKGQKPAVLWFTGLSGSGKSTIANLLERRLNAEGRHTYLLDGDNVRHGLCRDLGFSAADRQENIRRVGEVARLMVDAGLLVLISFISPFAAERRMAREMVSDGEFVEVFVNTPLEECVRRDPKGLYAKAMNGEIQDFTGIDSPYEAPENADIVVSTLGRAPDAIVDEIEAWLREQGYV